mmetsp:Transcript_7251/g.20462  ORF Transcript_7251/g.20462 Transcript_7251/m.20462 type:complete len:254 (+) Transcript_7251:1515-2276(+)
MTVAGLAQSCPRARRPRRSRGPQRRPRRGQPRGFREAALFGGRRRAPWRRTPRTRRSCRSRRWTSMAMGSSPAKSSTRRLHADQSRHRLKRGLHRGRGRQFWQSCHSRRWISMATGPSPAKSLTRRLSAGLSLHRLRGRRRKRGRPWQPRRHRLPLRSLRQQLWRWRPSKSRSSAPQYPRREHLLCRRAPRGRRGCRRRWPCRPPAELAAPRSGASPGEALTGAKLEGCLRRRRAPKHPRHWFSKNLTPTVTG